MKEQPRAAGAAKERRKRARKSVGPDQAEAAISLYHHVVDGKPINTIVDDLSSEDRRDANAMACALIFIRRMADNCTKEFYPSQYEQSGLAQVYDLLDALTTGRRWPPLRRFLAGLR